MHPNSGRASRTSPARVWTGRARRLTVVGVLSLAACGSDDPGADGLPSVEIVELASGSSVDASSLEGPAIVNLWATWCAPCRAEMPAFQQVADETDVVRFVGVNQGEDVDAATAFLDEVGVTFDQYLDPMGAFMDELRVAGLPATFVIDADGSVVEVHQGALDADGVRELVALVDGSATD